MEKNKAKVDNAIFRQRHPVVRQVLTHIRAQSALGQNRLVWYLGSVFPRDVEEIIIPQLERFGYHPRYNKETQMLTVDW